MVEVNGSLRRCGLANATVYFLHFVMYDVLKLQDAFSREQRVQGRSSHAMKLITWRGEGRRAIAKSAIKDGVFGKFRPDTVYLIIVLWVAEMDLIRANSYHGTWETSIKGGRGEGSRQTKLFVQLRNLEVELATIRGVEVRLVKGGYGGQFRPWNLGQGVEIDVISRDTRQPERQPSCEAV